MGDLIKTGVLCTRVITVFDTDGITPKTGLVNADFTTKNLTKDGAVDATAVTVTEINAGTRPGRYKVTWTPAATGEYEMRIAVPTYADRGFISEFTVTADGPLTVALVQASLATAAALATAQTAITDIQTDVDELQASVAALSIPTANANADALLDRAGAIDGKTPREAMRYIAATTVELSSGDPSGPVTFLGLDGVTKRVKSTMDADGNRTAVVLDPP